MGRPAGANRNTKERLLEASAELFSQLGYAGTSVKAIAGAVGIKDASIYNYFPSKEALFSEAIERERLYFAEAMDARGVFFDAATQRVAAEAPESLEAFEDFLLSYWEPFFADPRVARLRRILVLAAPCNDDARAMLLRLFYDHPLGFAGSMVEHLAAEGAMGQCNPRVAAYEVCGPALTMLGQGLAWSEAQRRLRSQYRAFTRAHSL
ncbi:TetR/AcrR family transcriptional regulator [Adlercreutzia aquisgranensis]|uniref:TetR/AcrR family transcriptional regulator n=1 Tax=Muribaculaceae bacterium Z82 TaxID=2304548 RepID=A0A7C9JER6_9BACT|nr:TetR/AcrR family transcriptional regulator [Adlercreutzia aquisgranensis]